MNDIQKLKLDRQIRLSLVTAWELGKKQKLNPYEYNLDTDKLGQPIYDLIISIMSEQKRLILEAGEEVRKVTKTRGKNTQSISGYHQALTDYQDRIKQL